MLPTFARKRVNFQLKHLAGGHSTFWGILRLSIHVNDTRTEKDTVVPPALLPRVSPKVPLLRAVGPGTVLDSCKRSCRRSAVRARGGQRRAASSSILAARCAREVEVMVRRWSPRVRATDPRPAARGQRCPCNALQITQWPASTNRTASRGQTCLPSRSS